MHRFRITRFLMIMLAALAAFAPAAKALAAPPIFETIPLAGSFDLAAGESCAFAVHGEVTGNLKIQHHYDRHGDLVFDNVTFVQWSIRVTNVETGVSLFSAGPDHIRAVFNQDGSITVAHTGLGLHLVAPGQGLVAASVGRIVLEITFENGVEQVEVIFEAGMHDPDYAAEVCAALAR